MRILFSITKSERGGAQTQLYALMRHAVEQGHEVALLAYPGGWLASATQELGGSFFANVCFKNSLNPLSFFRNKKIIVRAVQEWQPDLVHCHGGFAGLMTRLVLRRRVPVVFTVHGWSFAPGLPWIQRFLTRFAERFAARYTSRIITVSQRDYHLGVQAGILPTKMCMIHNAVSLPEIIHDHQHKEPVHIVYIARLTLPKTPEVLVRAVARLREVVETPFRVTIVGEGPQEEYLYSLIESLDVVELVKIIPGKPHAEYMKFLATADIKVLTSTKEGLPMSLLEAMSLGIPVVASDVGGINELVDDSVGILLEHQDEESHLASALRDLIESSSLREQKGSVARRRIQDNFALKDMCQKTFQVYQEVLNG